MLSRPCGKTQLVFIAVVVGLVLARLFQYGPATLSANDRSRWATVRALVDDGSYVVGRRQRVADGSFADAGIITEDGWQTVDRVLRPDTQVFLSSKPPLLATIVAAFYWLVKAALGWSIARDTWLVTHIALVFVNVVPLVFYLCLFGRLVSRFGKTAWGRTFVMGCACFATFITTFSVTLNNHTVAACAAMVALYGAVRIAEPATPPGSLPRCYVCCGFFAGLAACTELPATAFFVGLGFVLLRRDPRKALFIFAPMALIPVAGLLATNYLAVGGVRLAQTRFGSEWYEFEGSYWRNGVGQGIDAAGLHESKLDYAFNLLIGHHGLFSLTPIFLLAFVPAWSRLSARGAVARIAPEPTTGESFRRSLPLTLSWASLALTIVVVGFYLFYTNNYGGVTCGPRWLFWLTPFYLIAMLPAADALAQTSADRAIGYVLLALSAFSANYAAVNPWTHPWLYDLWKSWNWLPY
jgi:hypothetical protein